MLKPFAMHGCETFAMTEKDKFNTWNPETFEEWQSTSKWASCLENQNQPKTEGII
jgi:hypothetical protein